MARNEGKRDRNGWKAERQQARKDKQSKRGKYHNKRTTRGVQFNQTKESK